MPSRFFVTSFANLILKEIITLCFKVLFMTTIDPTEDLKVIRNMMERSTRFVSLSGLSGVFAGIIAMIGGVSAFLIIGKTPFDANLKVLSDLHGDSLLFGLNKLSALVLIGIVTLICALGFGIYFTQRKASKIGHTIWDRPAKLAMEHILLPLIAGGIFSLALIHHRDYFLVAPSMLVFYGLALLNVSKYTFDQVKIMGFTQLFLGLFGLFNPGYGLELWFLGFGILHVVYGLWMYKTHN
jgi:hypothetical protein